MEKQGFDGLTLQEFSAIQREPFAVVDISLGCLLGKRWNLVIYPTKSVTRMFAKY